MFLFYLKKLLVVLFLITFSFIGKEPSVWKVYNEGKYRIEELFIDSVSVQTNYYINDSIDSFRMFTRYETHEPINKSKRLNDEIMRFPIYTARKVNTETMKSFLNFFVESSSKTSDSMAVALWVPIEKDYDYSYKILKDDKIVWNVKTENKPVIKFIYPYGPKSDTMFHRFRLERTISKNNVIIATYKHNLWVEKNGKMLYNYAADDYWKKD